MTRHRQLLAGLAVYLLLHVCHATPAADLEPCAPGSGRPKPPAAPPPPAATAPSVTAASNLVAWYRFENNFLDSSPNAHHASNPGGGATFSSEAAVEDFSLQQQGYTQAQATHVRFPNTFDLYEIWNNHGASISLWFKMPLSPDAWANILFQFSDLESDVWPINRITLGQRGTDNGFWLGINDPLLGNDVRYRWKHVLDGYFDDAWHHVVLRIAADGVWSLFVDAVDTGEIFTHPIPNVRYTANGIGGSLWGDSLGSTGLVDDFRIYQKGLTAGEIAAIYAGDLGSAPPANAPSVTAASNLLAWYRFDTTPADQTTLVNHGTGGATFDATIHMQTNGIEQIAGSHANHAYFWPNDENNGNFVTIPAGILQAIDDDGYTFSFWMIDNQVTDNDMLIMSGLGAVDSFSHSNGGYFIKIYAPWANTEIVLDNYNGPVDKHRVKVSCVWCIENSKLTFMSFTRENIDANSMRLRIYKDAVLLHEEVKPLTMFTNADPAQSVFFMGFDHDATWRFRDKSLEDFRIYNRALTAEEIAAIYAGDLDSAEASIAEANSAPVSTACEACTPGFFSPNGTTCEPCAPGSISTHYNATSCEPCNATSTSFRGTSSCFDTAAHLAATGCVCGV